MEIDALPYDDVSYVQYLNKLIFADPKYPRLPIDIQELLEGRRGVIIINKIEFTESVLRCLSVAGTIITPKLKK